MLSTNTSGQTFPGLTLKAWVLMTQAGVIVKSFNVSACTQNATGLGTVTFTAAMGSANYIAKIQAIGKAGGYPATNNSIYITTAAGSLGFQLTNVAGAAEPSACYVEVWE